MEKTIPKSLEDMDEELCEYCIIPKNQQGVRCYGGEPEICSDSKCCEEAYESYLEQFEEEEL